MGCSSSSYKSGKSANRADPVPIAETPTPVEPLSMTKLRESESVGIATKESFQEETPRELMNRLSSSGIAVNLNLPFFRLADEGNANENETFKTFLKLLEVKKDEPHKTSHRSLYGHVKVCRLMMEGLKLEFLSQEKSFDLSPEMDSYRPDLVFRWRRRDRDIIVVCEVHLPLSDRPNAVSANNNGKREFFQCSRAVSMFGEDICCGLGFAQKKHEKQLVVIHAQGKYGHELVKLIQKHGRRWQIIVSPNVNLA